MTLKKALQISPSMFPIKIIRVKMKGKMSTQALMLTKGDRALSMLLETPSQAFSHINNRPSRAKLELGLALSKESALTSSDTVASQLGGEKGVAIGKAVYEMFFICIRSIHAL
ncbi:hypothetical protein BASA60_005542 [Batrachochytrium salamandrivorans]|nr:hypothetical protein BASA60_005542 [Batrachochytrium salamandrivorans]